MEKIMPSFKDEKDKLIVVAMIVASIFLSFLPALVVIFLLKDFVKPWESLTQTAENIEIKKS